MRKLKIDTDQLFSDFVIGRKQIMAFLGVKSWRTVRRWKKSYGMDGLFFMLPNRKPALMKSEMKLWFFIFNEKIKKLTTIAE